MGKDRLYIFACGVFFVGRLQAAYYYQFTLLISLCHIFFTVVKSRS